MIFKEKMELNTGLTLGMAEYNLICVKISSKCLSSSVYLQYLEENLAHDGGSKMNKLTEKIMGDTGICEIFASREMSKE